VTRRGRAALCACVTCVCHVRVSCACVTQGFIPLTKATHVPPNFAAVLEFMLAHSGRECKVEVVQISAVGS
jgi:hypothetical protein